MAWSREDMCRRAALELKNGFYCNLGIGMPTMVANYIPENVNVTLHSENGMLGIGPFPLLSEVDPDIINAGKQTITELPESSYFDSSESFAMIRGVSNDIWCSYASRCRSCKLDDTANDGKRYGRRHGFGCQCPKHYCCHDAHQ